MVLKGFFTKEWRRALAEPEEEEEEEEEDAQQTLQSLSNLKIKEEIDEDCRWHMFTEEILPRLPFKQLQTLKSVCKNWNQIISNPYFVQLHLNLYNQRRIRVLMPQSVGMFTEYNINCDDDEEEEIKQIHYPPEIKQRASSALILGSCDGLICFYWTGIRHTIAMYNPSTGKYFWVPSRLKDYYSINCSWFGHHPSSGEYLLVLGNFPSEVGVYNFTRRSNLKKIHSTSCCCINPQGGVSCFFEQRIGTLLHGALHWPVEWTRLHDRHIIWAYHLDHNKYFEISPPVQREFKWDVHGEFKLGVAEGCLFALCRTAAAAAAGVFEMWIMKEYKVQQSWTKYANIESREFYFTSLSPLGFFPNANDLILHPNKLRRLIKYTFNHNKALLLFHYSRSYEAIICVDTLVSPKIVGTCR